MGITQLKYLHLELVFWCVEWWMATFINASLV